MMTRTKAGRGLSLLCAALALLMPVAARAAWIPSRYADADFPAQQAVTLKTQYPVYKTGVQDVYVIMTNHTRKEAGYTHRYALERLVDGAWMQYQEELEDGVVAVPTGDLYNLSARGERADHNYVYGAAGKGLEDGTYRLIYAVLPDIDKPIDIKAYATFTVAPDGYDPEETRAPLASLPAHYPQDRAKSDGVFFVDAAGKAQNSQALLDFLYNISIGLPAKLRLLETAGEGAAVAEITTQGGYVTDKYKLERRTAKGVETMYYPYMHTRVFEGSTQLTLTNMMGKTSRTRGQYVLLKDVNKMGRDRIRLVEAHNAFNNIYITYDALGRAKAYYHADVRRVDWNIPGITAYNPVIITEERATDLLYMQFVSASRLQLTFATEEEDVLCTIVVEARAGKVVGVRFGA